jgi:hypothetical protein
MTFVHEFKYLHTSAFLRTKFISCPHGLFGPLKDARGPLIAMADTSAGSKTSKNSNTEALGPSPTKRAHSSKASLYKGPNVF